MPDDPSETYGQIGVALESLMETVGRMQVMATVPGEMGMWFRPDDSEAAEAFEQPGREKDRPYVAGAMGEIRDEKIAAVLALVDVFKARLEGLR